MGYRLAVVGSRTLTDYNLLENILDNYPRPDVIVSGGARGADEKSQRYAEKHGIPVDIYRPDWDTYGRAAGFKRNVQIIDNCDCVICFWDSVSKGSIHSVNLALNKNKPVKIIYFQEPNYEFEIEDIKGFQEDHRWLSNFWPTEIKLGSLHFNSAEAAYQASKFYKDMEMMKSFQNLTPLDAKRKGKEYQAVNGWYTRKLELMEKVVRAKFEQNKCLMMKLKLTGNVYLEETNQWQDKFWGVCDGEGENHLGKILMRIRDE